MVDVTVPPFLRDCRPYHSIAAARQKLPLAPHRRVREAIRSAVIATECEVARGRRSNSKRGASATSDCVQTTPSGPPGIFWLPCRPCPLRL